MKRLITKRLITKVHEVAYHRNGIGGEGFWAVTFTAYVDGEVREMVATVFEKAGHVAVLDVDVLAGTVRRPGTVAFGTNSWRGDVFESELRNAIYTSEQTSRSEVRR